MAVSQSNTIIAKLGAVGDEVKGLIDVNFLYWHAKAASADDDLQVEDSDGNIIWVDTADGQDYKNFFPLKNTVNGVKAAVMDSGELFIYKVAEKPLQV